MYERPELHPFETHYRPYEDYEGEVTGETPDQTVHWQGDAAGPIGLKVGQPYNTQAIDGSYDVDYFQIDLEAGHEYVVHVRGASTGDGTLEDPMIFGTWIYNEKTRKAEERNLGQDQGRDNGVGDNGFISFTPSETGRYYFGVLAEEWALDTSVGTYSVEIYDVSSDVGATADTAQELELVARDNNAYYRSKPVAGYIENPGDVDRFSFTTAAGSNDPVLVSVRSDNLSGLSLTLYDGSGNEVEQISHAHDTPGESAHIVFIPTAGDDYYVDVTTEVNEFGTRDVGSYKIQVMHTYGQYIADGPLVGNGSSDIIFGSDDRGDHVLPNGGDDVAHGGGGDDEIFGWGGDDRLFGEEGDDVLEGNEGGDRLHGGEGSDVLLAGSGNDFLDGGAGNDELTGGRGADTFYFSQPAIHQGVLRGFGDDTIEDFAYWEGDYINIDEIIAAHPQLRGSGEYVDAGNDGRLDDYKVTFKSSSAPNATDLGSITLTDWGRSPRSDDDPDYDPAEHFGLPQYIAELFTFYHEEEAQDTL